MGLFSSPTSYLGVDIGTSSIKMTELENYKGQARLKTYGYTNASINILRSSSPKNNQIIADYINQVASKCHVQTRQAIAALPTFSVFNFIITLPPMAKKDLSSAIKWEAKKFIPVPIEEMILDWRILNKKKVKGPKASLEQVAASGGSAAVSDKKADEVEDILGQSQETKPDSKQPITASATNKGGIGSKYDSNNYRILLTAAPKNLVACYIDIFKRAKLNLLSLETEAFALSRSLIGNDTSTVMIVDLGASSANICIIEDGVPVLNRGIDSGGENITKAIANSLNVNRERAEQFKRDFGLSTASGGVKNVPDVIQKSLNALINEIRYVFDIYEKQDQSRIEKIILTGGSAWLPNLPEYLTELLKLPVIIGDPWDRVIYPLDLKPILTEIGPMMATSIGLAMRDI